MTSCSIRFISGERELARVLVLCVVATICYAATTSKFDGTENTICKKYDIPEQIAWTCKRIADCPYSSRILQTIHEHRCSSVGSATKICCPERRRRLTTTPSAAPKSTTSSPPRKDYAQIIRRKCDEYAKARYVEQCHGGHIIGEEPVCGLKMDCKINTELIIVAGHYASPKEFPHMALIGEGESKDDIAWRCAGSLISERFILSAAHCTPQKNRLFKWAALGMQTFPSAAALNASSEKIFQIVKAYTYPGSKTSPYDHDIILYELKNPAKLNPTVRPICLPAELNTSRENSTGAIVTGWGLNDTSSYEDSDLGFEKQNMHFLPNDTCSEKYSNFDGKSMLCVGQIYHQDTCKVDSGSPVQMRHRLECMYEQVGIASKGHEECGSGVPGMYTRVAAYVEWIVNIVWPNEN